MEISLTWSTDRVSVNVCCISTLLLSHRHIRHIESNRDRNIVPDHSDILSELLIPPAYPLILRAETNDVIKTDYPALWFHVFPLLMDYSY